MKVGKKICKALKEVRLQVAKANDIEYAPTECHHEGGSAGTLQEIFQNAVQDHYLSFGFASPMVFMGKSFWTEDVPVYPFLRQMEDTGRYKNLQLTLTDDPDEIETVLKDFQTTLRKD